MAIEAQVSGIAFGVPSDPIFDQTNELINSFNNRYEQNPNAVGAGETVEQFSPVGFYLSHIAEYLER